MNGRQLGLFAVALTAVVSCGGHGATQATSTTPTVTEATFKAHVVALYAPFDNKPVPNDFPVGAARYDGFAAAVAALPAPASETAGKGAIVSAAHAAAATLRKYSSILDVPQPSDLDSLYGLQRLVRDLPP